MDESELKSFGVGRSNMETVKARILTYLGFLTGYGLETTYIDSDGIEQPLVDRLRYKNVKSLINNILVVGGPGIGKTASIYSVVREMNNLLDKAWGEPEYTRKDKSGKDEKVPWVGLKKIQLGQTVVGELQGIPIVKKEDGEDKVIRIPMEDLPNPELIAKHEESEYGILLLDEITSADLMQVQPALGLADDSKSIGVYKLPENWIVVALGNGPDCSNFVRFDDMSLTRFEAYDIEVTLNDMEEFMNVDHWNPDVIAYLHFDPTRLNVMPDEALRIEDRIGHMHPEPRTWAHFNNSYNTEELTKGLKYLKDYKNKRQQLISAANGNDAAIKKGLKKLEEEFIKNKTITTAEILEIAERCIGTDEGRKFAAFVEFSKTMHDNGYPTEEEIFKGKAKPISLEEEKAFFILTESCVSYAENLLMPYVDELIEKEKMSLVEQGYDESSSEYKVLLEDISMKALNKFEWYKNKKFMSECVPLFENFLYFFTKLPDRDKVANFFARLAKKESMRILMLKFMDMEAVDANGNYIFMGDEKKFPQEDYLLPGMDANDKDSYVKVTPLQKMWFDMKHLFIFDLTDGEAGI